MTGGEAGGIGLSLDQLFSGELHHDLAFLARRCNEGIVLLCRGAGQRLEPVGEMGGSPLNGPLLHAVGDEVRDLRVQFFPGVDRLPELLVHALREILPHGRVVEYVASEILRNLLDIAHITPL